MKTNKTLLLFLLLILLNTQPSLALSPEEQSLLLQQQMIRQQQEQQRQNLKEINRIRDNRVREGIVEEDKIELDEDEIKCSLDDTECIKKLEEQEQTCPHRFDRIELKGNKIYSISKIHFFMASMYFGYAILNPFQEERLI
jgi:hypothetical protein